METISQVISKQELLNHWIGHRSLTRKVLEKFPEKELFEFSIGGMRTYAQLTTELLSIAAPALKAIINREETPYTDEGHVFTTKAEYLTAWDKATDAIVHYWEQLKEEDFDQMFNLFGQYEFSVIRNVLYFIDNEIHHRGQGYVYLRALGIEPPMFWDRY